MVMDTCRSKGLIFLYIALFSGPFIVCTDCYGQLRIGDYKDPDSSSYLVFEHDMRLDLEPNMSIEILVAFPTAFSNTTKKYTFMKYGDPDGNNEFSLAVSGDRTQFLFTNRYGTITANCRFMDGAYH